MTRILEIRNEGSLLPLEFQVVNLTDAQLSIIRAIVKAPDLTYGEVLRFLADRQNSVGQQALRASRTA